MGTADPSHTLITILHAASQCLLNLAGLFASWPIPLLAAAIILLATTSGVLTRAIRGKGAVATILLTIATIIVSITAIAAAWTLIGTIIPDLAPTRVADTIDQLNHTINDPATPSRNMTI